MRVLIVEDEPNLGRQLRATLEGAGYAVDLATDGEDGHYLGSTENYDAVILDLGLPGLDGYEVARRIRLSADGDRYLIVAVTGYGRDEDLRRSSEANAASPDPYHYAIIDNASGQPHRLNE